MAEAESILAELTRGLTPEQMLLCKPFLDKLLIKIASVLQNYN